MPALDPSVLFPPTSHELELLVLTISVECIVTRVRLGLHHQPSRIRTLRFRQAPSAAPRIDVVCRMGVVDNAICVVGGGVVAAAGHRRFCVRGPSGMRHNCVCMAEREHRKRRLA